jgi:hypothetical protein
VAEISRSLERTSKPARSKTYETIGRVFGNRFVDWEIWVRGANAVDRDLTQMHTYVTIAVLFGLIALASLSSGFVLCTAAIEASCQNSPDSHNFLAAMLHDSGLLQLAWPPYVWGNLPRYCADERVAHYDWVWFCYLCVLTLGAIIALYALYLVRVLLRLNKSTVTELYPDLCR